MTSVLSCLYAQTKTKAQLQREGSDIEVTYRHLHYSLMIRDYGQILEQFMFLDSLNALHTEDIINYAALLYDYRRYDEAVEVIAEISPTYIIAMRYENEDFSLKQWLYEQKKIPWIKELDENEQNALINRINNSADSLTNFLDKPILDTLLFCAERDIISRRWNELDPDAVESKAKMKKSDSLNWLVIDTVMLQTGDSFYFYYYPFIQIALMHYPQKYDYILDKIDKLSDKMPKAASIYNLLWQQKLLKNQGEYINVSELLFLPDGTLNQGMIQYIADFSPMKSFYIRLRSNGKKYKLMKLKDEITEKLKDVPIGPFQKDNDYINHIKWSIEDICVTCSTVQTGLMIGK